MGALYTGHAILISKIFYIILIWRSQVQILKIISRLARIRSCISTIQNPTRLEFRVLGHLFNKGYIFVCADFKYKKDSVMEVGEADYKDCNATHPTFFSNNGNTGFRLDHSGTFYFISGASGHCEKGQKMIVRVMVPDESLPQNGKSSGYHDAVSPIGVFEMLLLHFVLECVAFYII